MSCCITPLSYVCVTLHARIVRLDVIILVSIWRGEEDVVLCMQPLYLRWTVSSVCVAFVIGDRVCKTIQYAIGMY